MKILESISTTLKFTEMHLPASLLASLERCQYSQPTPIQSESIPVALQGTDLVGVAQTGSGKTLAYALAVMALLEKKSETSRALILSPNRETADQVYRVFSELCKELPLTLAFAGPGVPVANQASQLKKNPRIIVATPGRISEHLQNNKLLLKNLEILVIDEADRMLELGFEPQLKFIQSTLRGSRQTMMYAASFGPKAEPVAKLFLSPEAVLIKSRAAETPVSSLEQKVFFLTQAQKNNRLIDELKHMKEGVIIFADSQENCVSIGRFLEHRGLSSDFVHGEMNPGHRNRVLREFREKKIQIMVTTDLLARGLDVPHVQHIINYDLPYKYEDFLHRIGRTARAGRKGSAITFVTPSDGRTYRKIKGYLLGAKEEQLSSNFKFTDNN
jgi:ATP-dependent RNA helicase RhlE